MGLTSFWTCFSRYQRSSTSVLLTSFGWQSLPQMVESSSSKLIHQTLITMTPSTLHARIHSPYAGATRTALAGAVRPAQRRTSRRRRTLTHVGIAAYNRLPVKTKTIGRKSAFRSDIKRYIRDCRTMYLHNYNNTVLSQHTERATAADDITYSIDDTGRLKRNTINHNTYNGKL